MKKLTGVTFESVSTVLWGNILEGKYCLWVTFWGNFLEGRYCWWGNFLEGKYCLGVTLLRVCTNCLRGNSQGGKYCLGELFVW